MTHNGGNTYSDQCRNDGVNSPSNELETVDVIMLGEVSANKCED